MRNALVLSRVLNTPLLVEPNKAMTVAGVVLRHAGLATGGGVAMGPTQEKAITDRRAFWRAMGAQFKEGDRDYLFDAARGIGVVEVTGSLAHRQWDIGESSGVMGYDGIGAQLQAALDAPDVRSVVIDIHSWGGEPYGCFQLADRIFAARQIKPIVALADEVAFSAAYALACAAEEVWLASDYSQVGSVGVLCVHLSFEGMLEQAGVKPTIIAAGAEKADGNPYQDLPADVAARIKAKIGAMYALFVAHVAHCRNLSEDAVRATEAGIFMGQAALDVGLADQIGPADELFARLARFQR